MTAFARERVKKYSLSAVFALLWLIVFNVIIFYAWEFYSASHANPLAEHPVREAFPDLDDHALDVLFKETWDPGWQYQSWVGFTEVARDGSYVTVYQDGFRKTVGSSNRLDDPAKDKIFFFGGSTTFGYNVADMHTIPSYFQRLSPQYDVFNFGRGYYYSKQENILFSNLLEKGYRPAVAIFIDGLNERCDDHPYQKELSNFLSLVQNKRGEKAVDWIMLALSQLPMLKAVNKLTLRWTDSDPHNRNCGALKIENMVQLRLKIRKAICDAFGVSCFSFLQPLAGVHGRHDSYKFLNQHDRDILFDKYTRLSSLRDPDWFDISDSLNGISHHAYVDNVHYSPEANERIARAVAEVVFGQRGEAVSKWPTGGAAEVVAAPPQ